MNDTKPHDSTGSPARGTRWRRSPLTVAAVAAAVLIAGGGGAYLATSASGDGGASGAGDGTPPQLALDALRATGPTSPPPNGIAPGEPDPSAVLYRATVALPDGPGSAHVYRPGGTVAVSDVARLAKALGVPGTPRSDASAWEVGTEKDGSGPLLRVAKQAPGTWTYSHFRAPGGDNCLKGRACPHPDTLSPDHTTGSDPDPGGDTAVSEAAAKKAAAPVLKALGQDDAKLDARQLLGAVRVVNADPVVGGLPTYGWTTGIQVASDGGLQGGTGVLDPPDRGDEYPVIGAAEALKQLNGAAFDSGRIGGCATPAPQTGTDRGPAADGGGATASAQAPCEPRRSPRPKVDIDKAVFGLAVQYSGGERILVPSWLFEAAPGGGARPYTLHVPAVEPRFLTPAPSHKEKPGGPSPVGPDKPAMSYSTHGRTLILRFWGGVCGTYAAQADESGTAVKVKVTEPKPDPEKMCVAIAEEQTVSTTLDRPVGDRQVVNAGTGERVPLR